MYFRACAMVRSGHQDLLITEMRVRPSYAAVKEGGGGSVCVVGEEGAVRVARTVIRRCCFSNDDGGNDGNDGNDGNENVKKAIEGLSSKISRLHVHHAFCTFLCCCYTTTT